VDYYLPTGFTMLWSLVAFVTLCLALTNAQDPASGWMAYAVGTVPSTVQRITLLQMQWKVGVNPRVSSAFFSPWFGMDPNDNLNLIQPVNPWGQSSWSMYTEYYQWQPTHNSNSQTYSVKAGQTLLGTLTYVASTDSYTLEQKIVETGSVSSQKVVCQNGKKYRIPYVVYEKKWPCNDYGSDQSVNFQILAAQCDGVDCINNITWAAKVKDPNCQMTAHILSQTSISITWNTSAPSAYDNVDRLDLIAMNTSPRYEAAAEAAKKHYYEHEAKHINVVKKATE